MIKKPTKKKWSVSESRLDALWGQAIRKKYNGRCALCGYPEGQAHHIVKRAKRVLRWSTSNGIYLCVNHHAEAHTGAGARKIYGVMGPNVIEPLYELEKINLKDWCLAHRMSVDDFRRANLVLLKEYLK